MQQKIYFQNKPLFLIDCLNAEVEEYLHHEETVFIDEFNLHTVKAMIHEMDQSKILRGVFLHKDVEAVLAGFKKKLTLIKAAGGLVYSGNHILLIFRRGKWDLPKGKLDEKEKLEDCAVREVKEETGLQNPLIEGPLKVTYHTYHEYGSHILKESHWYLMKSDSQSPLVPQTDEDIEQCEWVPIDQLGNYMEKAHASIQDVVTEGVKSIQSRL